VKSRAPLILVILLALSLVGITARPAARALSNPAAASKTIRVMTYNIHVGIGMDKKLDLQRIAETINQERPDLVCSNPWPDVIRA